jgi:hypothetical protein
MREVTADATLVERETLEAGSLIDAVVPRRELEKHLHDDNPLGLWFDLAEDGGERLRLTVHLTAADAREALQLGGDDDVALALDGESIQALVDDPDVEAHGMRGALAIAVTTAAIAAPAGLAANNTQVVRTDVSSQLAKPALTRQVVKQAYKPQVVRTAFKPQVARTALARQIHLVVLEAGVHVLR